MSNIKTWSTTAASNNSAAPDGWPEGMAPADVNNAAREMMAALRTQHEDASWIDLGDTPTYASATTFTIAGDVTAAYAAYRRIRATDSSTLYGSIVSSSYSAPNTTVTVVLDSGSLSGSLSAVALGILTEKAGPRTIDGDLAVTGTVTVDSVVLSSTSIVSKGADETVSASTTLQNDDDLSFSIAANEIWGVEIFFHVTSDSGADFKFDFTAPASCTWMMIYSAVYEGGLDAHSYIDETRVDTFARNVPTSASLPSLVSIKGTVTNSSTAGTFQLRWAQVTASGSATLKKGSWMKATKLA